MAKKIYPSWEKALLSSMVKRTTKLAEDSNRIAKAKEKAARTKRPIHISDTKLMMAFAELGLLEERRKALRNIIHQLTKDNS